MVEHLAGAAPSGPAADPRVLNSVFRALADPTRRDMLRRLAAGERTITDLAEPCVMSFAAASKHVRVLERAGLVGRSIQGRTHHCRLQPRPLAAAQAWLAFYQRFWTERLDALDAVLKAQGSGGPAAQPRPAKRSKKKGHAT